MDLATKVRGRNPGNCRTWRREVLFGLVLSGLLLLTSCSSGEPTGRADGGTDGLATDDSGAPTTPAERALSWTLAAFNGAPVTSDELAMRFAPSFLQQVPVAQLLKLLGEVTAMRPWTVIRIEDGSARSLTAVVTRGDGQFWRLAVAVDVRDQIQGLLLSPAGDLDARLASWDAIELALRAAAPRVNLLAARVDADACAPIHTVGGDVSLALGSTFKLWVLAALARDIGAGKHAWSDTIPIEDAKKSLPSGDLQNQPAGAELPLATYANKMISISDNTATDHLLWFVGRDAVEAMLPLTGHHAPAENQPFLSTRELFILKLMLTTAEQDAYVAAGTDERRALLERYAAVHDPRTYAGPEFTKPTRIDTLEWFATPGDLCSLMRVLRDAGGVTATAPVMDIMALNPGLPDFSKAFDYIGFKGGSEPGVLNLTWLVRRKSDQQWLFLTLGFNDTEQDIDGNDAVYVAAAARALLAQP